MKKLFISSAYIYPVCPLNINHAKMFVIGDIIARYARMNGENVFFPVATHYSGNTAHHIAEEFGKIFSSDEQSDSSGQKIFNLYKNIYGVPSSILKSFVDPLNILNFYSREILWELKSLDISGDYEHFYTTNNDDFSIFINSLLSFYEDNHVLVKNKKDELALNYDDRKWQNLARDLISRTEFIQSFHKNNVLSAMKDIRNDWGLLREGGLGVIYKEKWIVDPMFDSELFTVFDLYEKFKSECTEDNHGLKEAFQNLFEVLKSGDIQKAQCDLVRKIVDWLPCDIFICEEHLKNWIVKKFYAESLILNNTYQTKKYFILGMGMLQGKRMSASRGHSIMTKDLINRYGPTKARLIIILSGGHPSKTYNYAENLPEQADKLLGSFESFYTYLMSIVSQEILVPNRDHDSALIQKIGELIEVNMKKGYYRQAIIELLSILPIKFRFPERKIAVSLIAMYKKYLDILLPRLLQDYDSQIGKSITKSN